MVYLLFSGFWLKMALTDPKRFEDAWKTLNRLNPLLSDRQASSEFYKILSYIFVAVSFLLGLITLIDSVLKLLALVL